MELTNNKCTYGKEKQTYSKRNKNVHIAHTSHTYTQYLPGHFQKATSDGALGSLIKWLPNLPMAGVQTGWALRPLPNQDIL